MSTQTIWKQLGSTSVGNDVALVQNAGSTSPGDPILGLAYNTSGLQCYYRLVNTGTPTQLTLVTLSNAQAAYASGGFVQIDSVKHPGLYRLDLPSAVTATAGEWSITLSGTPAGTVGSMETHHIKLFVGDVAGIMVQQMVESYPALATAATPAQALQMLLQRQAPTKRQVIGTAETVYKLDGVTVAFTYTLDLAGNPTTYTRAT